MGIQGQWSLPSFQNTGANGVSGYATRRGYFFNDPLWKPRLVYLADIFDQHNKLNLKLQRKDTLC